MKKRKYPISLFLIGFITDVLFRFSWLFLPGAVLLVIGLFSKPCQYIGQTLLLTDIVISLIDQIMLRKAFLSESDDEDFQDFQDSVSGSDGWRNGVRSFLEKRISGEQNDPDEGSDGEENDQNDDANDE